MSTEWISFDMSGTVSQEIKILTDEYSRDDIIKGLNDGTLLTTTWYDGEDSFIVDADEYNYRIALIVTQEVDGEYYDFG